MKKLKNQQEKEQQNFKINLQESFALQKDIFSFDLPTYVSLKPNSYSRYKSSLNPKDYTLTVDRPPIIG